MESAAEVGFQWDSRQVGGKILDSKVRVGSFGARAHGGGGLSSEAFGWQFWWRVQGWLPSGDWGVYLLSLWQD